MSEPTYRPLLQAGITSLDALVQLSRALVEDVATRRITPGEAASALRETLTTIGPWLDAHLQRAYARQASAAVVRAKRAWDADTATLCAKREQEPATAEDIGHWLDSFAAFVEAIDQETGTA
jgi:hypothetical protein